MALFSSEPGPSGDSSDRGKPRIWAEGHQRPGFDLRAFLRVSTANSRAFAAPALDGIAGYLDRLGTTVEEGRLRIPAARLGHTGRFLPSHVSTGRRLRDAAAMTHLAGQAARGDAPEEPMAFRGWSDTPVAPAPVAVQPPEVLSSAERPPLQRPKRPTPLPPTPVDAAGDRDTLEAIRNLMHTVVVEPVHPKRQPKPQPAPILPTGVEALPELAPAEPALRGALFKMAARAMGAAIVGLVFPVGMAQAGYALARGEDLRLAP